MKWHLYSDNSGVFDTFNNRRKATDAQQEYIRRCLEQPSENGTSDASNCRIVPEWRITEQDETQTCFHNIQYGVTAYIEEGGEYREWSVASGLTDQTMCSVIIPGTREEYSGEKAHPRAVANLLSLVMHLDVIVTEFRQQEDYRQAKQVEADAPPTRAEGGVLPVYKVRNQMREVYEGDKAVEQALDDLQTVVEESDSRTTEPA